MFIPEGMTEAEVVDIMERASKRVSPKYKFGYMNDEDMVAQGIVEAIKALNTEKFQPKPNGDLKKQLLNFLMVHIRNRISNFRRKHSFRYASPDSKSNKTKYNLMHPLKIHSQGLVNSEIFAQKNTIIEDISGGDIIEKIRDNISMSMLKDFVKWTNGAKLPASRKKALIDRLKEVLDGYQSPEEE